MTKTEENLKAAFSGESQARNKYDYFAKVARKQGFHYIAKIFEETALNEMQHAKEEFKQLKGIGDTAANLKEAIAGEHYENTEMYPQMEKDAKKEGDEEAAILFKEISEVEEHHEARYKALLKEVESNTIFKKETSKEWVCRKCGYVEIGTTPPKECPSCDHESNYFEIKCEDF